MEDERKHKSSQQDFEARYPDLAKEEREENIRFITQDKRISKKKKGFFRRFFEDDWTPGI